MDAAKAIQDEAMRAYYERIEVHLGLTPDEWEDLSEDERYEALDDYWVSPTWGWESAEAWEYTEGYIAGLNFALGVLRNQSSIGTTNLRGEAEA